MNRAVHRLHRRVGEEGKLVGGIDRLARSDALRGIADRFRYGSFLLAGAADLFPDLSGRDRGVGAFVPDDFEGVEPLHRRPHVIADDGDEVVQNNDLSNAGKALGLAVVDAADLAAKHRTRRQGGEFDARRHRIDAKSRLAVDLVGRIQPLQRLADELEVCRRLQRRVLGGRHPRGSGDERAIGELSPARIVKHFALGGATGCGVDPPDLRRRRDEQRPGARRGFAQGHPEGANRSGAARGL